MLTYGSLCTGYDGLRLGLEMAGLELAPLWHAENDESMSKVLEIETAGTVPNLGDIKSVDWSTVPHVDIMTSGDPCQSLSVAGRQLGREDPRFLWPWVRQAYLTIRPRMIFFENVANIAKHDAGRTMAERHEALRSDGYAVRWMILGACAVGAPHHRHRYYAVARHGGPGAGPAERLDDGRAVCGGHYVLPTPLARDSDGRGEGSADYWLRRAERRGRNGMPLGAAVNLLPTPVAADAVGGGAGGGRQGSSPLPAVTDWGAYADAISLWASITGHPAPEPTEPTSRGGRRMSALLPEWMMGLRPGLLTGPLSRREAIKGAGNGVVPRAAAAAWQHLTRQEPTPTLTLTPSTERSAPMNLADFGTLLIEQGKIKRQAKRDPRFAKYPAGTLTELGEIAMAAAGLPTQAAQPSALVDVTRAELEAMSPITGDKAIAELETVEANIPAYDLTHYGFRAPHPAPVVGGLVELEADPYEGMDPTEAYLRGLGDQPPSAPARDPFVAPAHVSSSGVVVDPDPKESTVGSPSPATGDASASDSPTTEPSSRPQERLIPSMAGDGSYVKPLTITAAPPPQPPPFTGNPADYEPGNHYGPGLPASQYPNAPEADPKA